MHRKYFTLYFKDGRLEFRENDIYNEGNLMFDDGEMAKGCKSGGTGCRKGKGRGGAKGKERRKKGIRSRAGEIFSSYNIKFWYQTFAWLSLYRLMSSPFSFSFFPFCQLPDFFLKSENFIHTLSEKKMIKLWLSVFYFFQTLKSKWHSKWNTFVKFVVDVMLF